MNGNTLLPPKLSGRPLPGTNSDSRFQAIFLDSWRPYAWLAFIVSLLYAHILTFSDYTYFDDYILIKQTFSHIDDLSDIARAFFEDVGRQAQGGNLYRPFLTITFILSAQISGTELFGYHLINILLHAVACCMLFATLNASGSYRSVSFAWTVIFSVHPALTQAVAWVSGRNDSLLAVTILPCFITFIRYTSSPSAKWFLLHVFFFALALLTKETAIAFPAIAFAYAWLVLRKSIVSLTTVPLLVGWGAVILNWQILRRIAQMAQVTDLWQAFGTIFSHLWIAFSYLGAIFWPLDLFFAPVETDVSITSGLIALTILLLVIAFSQKKQWGLVLFSFFWFGIFLAPTFFHFTDILLPPKFYEHRIYVPFIGILFTLSSLSFSERLRLPKRFSIGIIALLVIALGILSYSHSFDYKDSLALHEYAARTSPNDDTQFNRVTMMHIPKKLAGAIEEFRGRTIAQPDSPSTASNTQEPPVAANETKAVLEILKKEEEMEVDDPDLNHAFATALFARGFLVSAEQEFKRAIEQEPQNAELRHNLGVLYYNGHAEEKAEKEWLQAVRLNPLMGDSHHNLCYLYYQWKRYDKALQHCEEAQRLNTSVSPQLVDELRRDLEKSEQGQSK